MRALAFVRSQNWLITEEALQTIESIAAGENDFETLAARVGQPLNNARRVQNRDGVAVVPIVGPIFRYANLFAEISGATSTQMLSQDIRTALDDPEIHSIVLDINSPGGMAAGINELGDMIYAARKEKPILAYAGHHMQSAAYWLGSAAKEVIAEQTAILGSIGAVISFTDTTARDQKAGVRTIEIVSSQSPHKRLDINQDDGRAKVQKIVDDLAGVFVSAVARNRGIDVSAVLSNFGQGGSMLGQDAVDAGMADRIGSLESVIAELSQSRNPYRRMFPMAKKGPITISSTDELRNALAQGHTAEEITVQSVDVEKIKTEAHAAGVASVEEKHKAEMTTATAKAREEGAKAERERVVGLQAIAMKGFEKEVAEAVSTGATVADTAVKITGLARERGTTLTAQQEDASQAINHGGQADAGGKKEGKGWGKITDKFNKRKK